MSSVPSIRPSHGTLSAPMLRRSMKTGTVAITLMVFLLVTVFSDIAPASAYWKAAGASSAAALTGTLLAPTNVTVPAQSTGNVAVSWAPQGALAPVQYFVTRTLGGVTTAACGSSPTALVNTTSCTDTGMAAGTYTYQVTAAFRSWTATSAPSGQVIVTPSSTTRLVFVTPAASGAASNVANLGPLKVELQNGAGTPLTAPSGGAVVALTSSSLGAKVFSLTLGGPAVTSATIPAGSSAATFYYGDQMTGTPTITARTGSLSASQTATVTAAPAHSIVFTAAPKGPEPATRKATVGPFTVQLLDAEKKRTFAVTDTVISLSSTKASTFFATRCDGATITTATILAGTSEVSFNYGSLDEGSSEVTATSGTMTATHKFNFNSPSSTPATCSSAMRVAQATTSPLTSSSVSLAPESTPTAGVAPMPAPVATPVAPAPASAEPAPTATMESAPALTPVEPAAPSDPPATEALVATDPSSESSGS